MARKTPGIYIAIRGDYSAFETDLNRAKLVAKEQGEAIAKSIGNAVSKADLTGGINKLTRELKTAQTALASGAFKGQVSGLDEIAKAAGVSSKQLEGLTNSMLKSQAAATANRAFEYLQKNAGLSTLELAKLRVQLGDTSGAMSTLWSGAKAAAVPVMAIGAAAIYAGKACFGASLQMDRLVKSYTTIEGSTSGAVSQLDYIYEISNKLGLEFQSTAEAAKGFFAAGKGSALQKDLNGIFEGVSQAGAALSLSTEQMDGVFLALGQMISKGKVQAEELRGQLGERLPGAFNLAARAMGVTTAQLDDMLKKGQVTAEDMLPKLAAVLKDEFGPAAEQAAQGAQGAVNRLSTEWNLFKATVMDNGPIITAINAITDAMGKANAAQREQELEKRMEAAGWEKATTMPMWGVPFGETVKKYTEEQKEIFREYEKVVLADAQKMKSVQEEANKILAEGEARTADFLKNTTESKIAALNKDYDETVLALTKKMILYQQQGQDFSGLQKELLKVDAEYDRQLEALNKKGMKSAEDAAKKAALSATNLDELRKSVEALEAANIPAAKSFDQMAEKIREQSKQTQIAIEADAARMVATKKLTVAQAEEWKGLKFREDAAKTTQKLAEVEAKRGEQDKKYADLRLDFEKRYADMVGLSSEAVSKSISKQAEEYRKAIEAGENAAEELVRLEEWKRDQIQRASREAMDGARVALRDYQVEASNQAKSMNDAFRGLFSGMDSGWKSAWEQMIETGKVSLSSFRSVFASFLADLMHMAITRPITVQIAGVVSGMLGTGGVAQAAGGSGGMGGIGNLSGVSNLMPGSWFSGIGDTINNTMAGWFPGTFASATAASSFAGQAAVSSALAEFGAGTSMATETAFNALADGIVAQNAAQSTFLSSVTPYFTAAGLGSLGYSMLGGKLGLPQSKYSGLTAGLGAAAGWGLGGMAAGSAALAGTGMAAGATFGSVVPVVGTIIGAIAGGALGSLFGQERKTHPSVYGHMMDQGYTTDAQSYIDAFMEQATYDRAGKTEASAYAQVIGEAASQTAGNILNLAAMLPDEYKKSVEDQLESATWSAGRGYSGASWNLQNWKKGMAEERIQEAVDDMFEQMGYGANKAFAEAGIGELFDSFDLSTEEGFKKAQTAISAISSITTAIDEIKAPTSEAEQQAKAFVAQMDALGEAVKASGLNAAYADKMIGEYRTAYVDKYVETLEEMFNPLSQIEQQAKGYKEAIDGYVSALTTMGASEAQLAQVRGYTRDAINNITGSLDAAFFPLSEVETQTKSTMESLLAYKAALETLGASAEELTRIDAAWGKMQSDLLDKARAYVSTTPEVVSQAAAMNAEFDALREAMLLAGNATADLTELEQIRAQAVAALQAQYVRSFDQGLAQRYATLNGTSDAVSRAISQENELRETITKFGEDSAQVSQLLHIQAAENVAAAQAAVDSLQNQLNSLKQQAIQAEISSITEQLNAAKTLKETWERLSESLYDSRAKLWTSDADALGLFAQRDAAQSEFDRLYRLTMQGDSEAAAKLASSGDTLLSLLKETSANGEQYTAGFWDVEQKLKDAESVAGKQLSEAQKSYNTLESQLKAQQSMLDALGYNNNSLDAINAQIVTVGNQLAKALGNLNAAQSNPNYGGTTSGGGYVSWEDKLLQKKADALNAGQTLAPGQTAGGWTPEKVLDAIKENGWTVTDWYNYHGKAEGFAAGGLTPLNEMFSVGEAGKEYILSPSQYVVLNNSMTRKLDEMQTLYRQTRQPVIDYRLMQMPVMGTDGDVTAEIVKLREEVSELKNILRQTLTKTDTISANSGKIYRMAQKWDSDGLPATRTS